MVKVKAVKEVIDETASETESEEVLSDNETGSEIAPSETESENESDGENNETDSESESDDEEAQIEALKKQAEALLKQQKELKQKKKDRQEAKLKILHKKYETEYETKMMEHMKTIGLEEDQVGETHIALYKSLVKFSPPKSVKSKVGTKSASVSKKANPEALCKAWVNIKDSAGKWGDFKPCRKRHTNGLFCNQHQKNLKHGRQDEKTLYGDLKNEKWAQYLKSEACPCWKENLEKFDL